MIVGGLFRTTPSRGRAAVTLATLLFLVFNLLPTADVRIGSGGSFLSACGQESCFASKADCSNTCTSGILCSQPLDNQSLPAVVASALIGDDEREPLSTLADFYSRSSWPMTLPAVRADCDSKCLPRDLVVTLQRLVI